MMPLGPVFFLTLLLVGIMTPREVEIIPTNLTITTFLTYLSSVAGTIVFTSFIITRVWRRLL